MFRVIILNFLVQVIKSAVTLLSIFCSIDEISDFPQMVMLLNYQGKGISAELFFDAKAMEALSLIFERHMNINSKKKSIVYARTVDD